MMRQYVEMKNEHPDCILFFRLGDFYEMFFDDAKKAADVLDIVLTSREMSGGERAPMCGVPHHAAENYLARLVDHGYRVAICEQVEDPRKTKGLVRREVVRVVTPGTLSQLQTKDERSHSFVVAVSENQGSYGLAAVDVGTGTFTVTQFDGQEACKLFSDEVMRLRPAECLPNAKLSQDPAWHRLVDETGALPAEDDAGYFVPERAEEALLRHFGVVSLKGYGLEGKEQATTAAGALLQYLQKTQRIFLAHLSGITYYHTGAYMLLDEAARRNLEITRRQMDGKREGSLLWVVDHTVTAMGARCLKDWLERPLCRLEEINERLGALEELVGDALLRLKVKEHMSPILDLERLASRIAYGSANGRDLLGLAASLRRVGCLKNALAESQSSKLVSLHETLSTPEQLCNAIEAAIEPQPPVSITEGGLIRTGYDDTVDQLRLLAEHGKQWIADLERSERERTGIKSLKVGFNKVFGYYIEVTRSNLGAVPEDYIRKQTLANAERYVTPRLKEEEEKILNAQERLWELEHQLFLELRQSVLEHLGEIRRQAALVAQLDCLLSFAILAVENDYCRPELEKSKIIAIEDGRHPVIEKVLGPGQYVPNDVQLDEKDKRMLIITGPNMAGKSTYCRQVALLALLAQCGSYVPARSCRLGLVDRIFTRVGAHDNLSAGQSTFMVEMTEVSSILNAATDRSLVILDELGRGTSTFDGLSIAWAVAEYLHTKVGTRTLLATHYREMNELASQFHAICNMVVAVQEEGEDIRFLYRIVPGQADASYGIHVARLAGVPPVVLERARSILEKLESEPRNHNHASVAPRSSRRQLALSPQLEHPALRELKGIVIDELTPLEALNRLQRLQRLVREEES